MEFLIAIIPRVIILLLMFLYGLGEMNREYDRKMEEHFVKTKGAK